MATATREQLISQLKDLQRELTAEDLKRTLGQTVKRDDANKTITFLAMLLAQTNQDQFNVAFQAESSTGKSYIPLEILEYFPSSDKRTYGGASPTSFYHEVGRWMELEEAARIVDLRGVFDENELADEKRKVILLNLENKILVFLDQPHWQLMERLRPLASHDKKILRYAITDKNAKGALRSKSVLIIGFPTLVFSTAKVNVDEQERTRTAILSPEISQEKLRESLSLLAKKLGDRKTFQSEIEGDPERLWLKHRVHAIRDARIKEINIPQAETVLEQFERTRPKLAPRHTRDFPRLLFFIKGFALLNCFQRERNNDTIIANQTDVKEGFELYKQIADSNELGISPEIYQFYNQVIQPLSSEAGINRIDIAKAYRQHYGRPIGWKRLTNEYLPALESSGLIHQERNPNDRRQMLVYTTQPNNMPPNSGDTLQLHPLVQGHIVPERV